MKRLATKKTVLLREGVVELLLLERVPDDGTRALFAVSFPHKIGNLESSQRMTMQFMHKLEALREFDRYVKFYAARKAAQA